jgi:hypothetical protein
MRGVWRATVFLFGAQRIQVGLVATAILSLAGGPLLLSVLKTGAGAMPSWWPLLDFLSVNCLAYALALGGLALRAAAASHMMSLIPHARLRLAVAALLAVILAAALVTMNAAFTHHAALWYLPPWGSPSETFGGTLSLATLCVLWTVGVAGGLMWFRLGLVVATLSGFPLFAIYHRQLSHALGLSAAAIFAVVALVSAVCFTVWYLRARRIAPPSLNSLPVDRVGIFGPRPKEVLHTTTSRAANIYLLGHPSVTRACVAWLVVLGCGNLALQYAVARAGRVIVPDWSISFVMTLAVVSATGAYFANQVVHRSRTLWIRAGLSRRELFETVEKLSLSCLGLIGGLTLAISAAMWLKSSEATALYLTLLVVSTSLCCVYCSLLDVRRESPLQLQMPGLYTLAALVLAPDARFFPFPPDSPWEFLAPAAEIVAALILRSMARARWQQIDWMICKPARHPFRLLGPAR